LEDFFPGRSNISPQELIETAQQLGVDEELLPLPQEIGSIFMQVGARSGQSICRAHFWRLMAVLQERFHCQRQVEHQARMQCLAHANRSGPSNTIFGLGAFLECLLKLALHRLGSKGATEIQRASPSWWKCVWLLVLLGGRFAEHAKMNQHYKRIRSTAMLYGHVPGSRVPSKSRQSLPRASTVLLPPAGERQRPSLTRAASNNLPMPERSRASTPVSGNHRRKHPGAEVSPTLSQKSEASAGTPKNLTPCASPKARPTSASPRFSRPSTPVANLQQQQRQRRLSKSTQLSVRTGSSLHSTPRTDLSESSTVPPSGSVVEPRPRSIMRRADSKRKVEQASVKEKDEREKEREREREKEVVARESLGQSLDTWWQCIYTRTLPMYVPPMARLTAEAQNPFHHTNAESRINGGESAEPGELCAVCLEQRSPSGWGSPGCPACSGVEEFCFPVQEHLFSELLRTPPPPTRLEDEALVEEDEDVASTSQQLSSRW